MDEGAWDMIDRWTSKSAMDYKWEMMGYSIYVLLGGAIGTEHFTADSW